MVATQGSNAEVVPMPKWSRIVGFARVAIAILVLAFTAAATSIWGIYPSFGIALTTSSATLLIFGYYIVALSHKPTWYNRWAVLGLEIFGVIFWLVSFSTLANFTSWYNGSNYWYGDGDSYGFWNAPYLPEDVGFAKRANVGKTGHSKYHAGVALAGTAAGLGAIEFVLYSVTLLVFGLALHKQRTAAKAGLAARTTPVASQPSAGTESEVVDQKPETATETTTETV